MKEALNRLVSSVMAVLLLSSTVSWTVDKHLCMGRVMDVAFFSNAEDCGMESAMRAFGEQDNHCCDDESFTLEGQDDLKLSFHDFELDQQIFLVAFTFSYQNLFEEKELPVPDQIYPPPLLVHDLNILYEVFLI